MRAAIRVLLVGSLAAIGTSCGDVVRDGRSPVFLVIQSLTAARGGASAGAASGFLQSDVQTVVTAPPPCSPTTPCRTIFSDAGSVTLRLSLKDVGVGVVEPSPNNEVTITRYRVGVVEPSPNNEVTITRYRVDFRRSDGRNTPGVDVPYGFDGGVTGTVGAAGALALGFELVRHVAKMEAPLVHLIESPVIISTIAEVTFYGQDRVGNDISATGFITVDFGNFGDQ